MGLIEFDRTIEKAGFFSPLAGMAYAEQTIEVRRDPLTATTAVSSSELATKEEMFFGKTDWDHAGELARTSREGCFFCPEKVMETTPRYPEEVVAGGRLQRGRALVFPNLFPLAALHAVVTYPERHFLRPTDFSPDLLEEGLGAAVDFAGRAERNYAGLEHLELCCNHMLPAGASMVHAHFQVFGGPAVPWLVRMGWERSAEFKAAHGVSYWDTLVSEERERGERLIAERDGVAWLAPFAPTGNREVIAVVPAAARISALDDEQVAALASGMSAVLAWYERAGLSAFNFTLYGGRLSESGATGSASGGSGPTGSGQGPSDAVTHPVVLRVIARSAFKPDYRTDDYFLQKQLGGELVFETPEAIAATLRPVF
jgi:UDPglucose--hexose-1-phosphate uridylyltransferase